jgi:hypothetical protein
LPALTVGGFGERKPLRKRAREPFAIDGAATDCNYPPHGSYAPPPGTCKNRPADVKLENQIAANE